MSRVRLLVLGVAAATALVPSLGPARADEPVRWVLLKSVVPESDALVTISLTGEVSFAGDEPATIGLGGGGDDGGWLTVESRMSGPVTFGVTSPAGRTQTSVENGGFEVVHVTRVGVAPAGTRFAVLLFVTGGHVSELTHTISTSKGTMPEVEVETGTRSGVVRWTDGEGVAVEAGPVGAGAAAAGRSLDAGIAGAPVYGVGLSAFGWQAPGRERVPDTNDDRVGFAGPGGSWGWDWQGAVALQGGAVAAYAEIGDAWPSFRPRSEL